MRIDNRSRKRRVRLALQKLGRKASPDERRVAVKQTTSIVRMDRTIGTLTMSVEG